MIISRDKVMLVKAHNSSDKGNVSDQHYRYTKIPKRLQLQGQVTLVSLTWSHK